MKPAEITPSTAWARIKQLGEQLLTMNQLVDQRALIERVTNELLNAKVDLWMDERLFRLPGLNQEAYFPERPPNDLMVKALDNVDACCLAENKTKVAVALHTQDLTLGVLLVQRLDGRSLRKAEVQWLEALGGHVALALVASHRFAVEQWRVEQLILVRRVSAQIANVLNLDTLTRRVTQLILDTFKYYYVAIFTRLPEKRLLEFWSSAGPGTKRTRRRSSRALKIELGQGLIGKAAESGIEIISNNVETEPRFHHLEPLPGTKSEVVLPLRIGDRILGVLDIQSDRQDAFHPNDLLVLRSLADAIAIAVNSTQLYSDLDRRVNHLAIVSEVSKEISSVLELDLLLSRVAQLITERMKFPYVQLFTVHLNRRQIIFEAGSGPRTESLKGYTLDLDTQEGIIPWVARNGEIILANDVSKEPRYKPSPYPPMDTQAELTIPLLYDQKTIGVLDLQSNRLNAFTLEDKLLLETLAEYIAVAIHNADMFLTERWRRQVADSLREVAGLLSADAGVDDVLDSVLRELERNLPSDVSAVWLLEGEELFVAHIHGADALETETALQRWPEARLYLLSALDATEPVIRSPTDPFGPSGIAGGFSADYSSIAVALRVGDRPLGLLTLSHQTSGRYGHEAQAITSTFASYAAVAIENARLFDSAQEQAYASAALLQVAQTVVNSSSLDETIGSIIRITPILVGVKACAIYLWDGNHFLTGQGYGFPDDIQSHLCGRFFTENEFPLLDATSKKMEMTVGVLTGDLPNDWLDPELAMDEHEVFYALQTGERLLIGFPLAIRNDFLGVMLVQEDADSRRFREKRIEIINGITQQVAMSIQNDHLQHEMVARERLEHEIQLARQIQRTFLPEKLPELIDWNLAATWRTARQVGGDFYDVIELPGQRLGLFIADVSDKGIPAALFMALTRTLVRAAILVTDSPAEVMGRVNGLILPDNREEMFVTAVYGVIDLAGGTFTYANAGHNPPIWINGRNGELTSLQRTGAALGVIENLFIEEKSITLEPGDTLLLYTDGLTEAFSPADETFGIEGVEMNLRDTYSMTVKNILEQLELAVDDFMNTLPAADDLTMLAIQRFKSTA